MNLLCLSVTVKITFTSSDRLWKVCIGSVSSPAVAEAGATALAAGPGDCVADGAGAVEGAVCATAEQQISVSANNSAINFLGYMSGALLHIIVWETNPQSPI